MSLTKKQVFIAAVEECYQEFDKGLSTSLAKKKLLSKIRTGIKEVRDELVTRTDKWLLPVIPDRKFIRDIHKTLWFHIYSDKYAHKFHNTIQHEKGEFLREIRFKLRGTRNI